MIGHCGSFNGANFGYVALQTIVVGLLISIGVLFALLILGWIYGSSCNLPCDGQGKVVGAIIIILIIIWILEWFAQSCNHGNRDCGNKCGPCN